MTPPKSRRCLERETFGPSVTMNYLIKMLCQNFYVQSSLKLSKHYEDNEIQARLTSVKVMQHAPHSEARWA